MTKKGKPVSAPEHAAPAEELDHVRYVVRPRTRMALFTIGVLLTLAVVWSFVGSVSTKVSGQGILIRSGTLFPVVTVASGQLLSLEVEVGQVVKKGSVIAKLDQPLLKTELREAQRLLGKLNEERALLERYEKRSDTLVSAHIDEQRATLRESIQVDGQFIKGMEVLVADLESLQKQGIVSNMEVEKQRADLRRAQIQLLQDQQDLSGLDVLQNNTSYQVDQRLVDLVKQVIPMQERVLSLRERLQNSSEVKSLHNGVIVEIHKNPGIMLQQGESVATLELNDSGGQGAGQEPLVVAYVAPFQGVELKPGMQVQVVPESVREEEYGVMLGKILSISPYPVSPKGIMRVLDNQDLVKVLTKDGAPVMVTVGLLKDPSTPSGYRWSSGKGPPTAIKSGVQCVIRIIARSRAPIELVIPELKRRLFGTGKTGAAEGG